MSDEKKSNRSTGFWQNIAILITLVISVLSLYQSYLSGQISACLSVAMPKLTATTSEIEEVRSRLILERDAYRQAIASFALRHAQSGSTDKLGDERARELGGLIVNTMFKLSTAVSDLKPYVRIETAEELERTLGSDHQSGVKLQCDFKTGGQLKECIDQQIALFDTAIELSADEILLLRSAPTGCESKWIFPQ